jgi:putative holliday junction resolvase
MNIPETGRIAAIDYGTVRIGIAVTDSRRTIASPLENYTRRDLARDAEHFKQLVREEQIALFVVGLPVHNNGRESQKSIEAEAFGAWLTGHTGVPVVYFDERFTTVEAEQLLAGAKLTKARRKERLDKLAAQILLTAYLESGQRDAPPGRLDG